MEMTELVTVEHDYSAPMLERTLRKAVEWQKHHERKPDNRRKVDFVQPRFRSRCFTGREEIGYANI